MTEDQINNDTEKETFSSEYSTKSQIPRLFQETIPWNSHEKIGALSQLFVYRGDDSCSTCRRALWKYNKGKLEK